MRTTRDRIRGAWERVRVRKEMSVFLGNMHGKNPGLYVQVYERKDARAKFIMRVRERERERERKREREREERERERV